MAELGLVGDGPNSYQVIELLWTELKFRKNSEEVYLYIDTELFCRGCQTALAWGNTQSNYIGESFHE